MLISQVTDIVNGAAEALNSTSGRSDATYLNVILLVILANGVGFFFFYLRKDGNSREVYLRQLHGQNALMLNRSTEAVETIAESQIRIASAIEKLDEHNQATNMVLTQVIAAGIEMTKDDKQRAAEHLNAAKAKLGT